MIVSSTALAAEMLRRRPDGTWPEQPDLIGPDDALRIESIAFTLALRAVYRSDGLL